MLLVMRGAAVDFSFRVPLDAVRLFVEGTVFEHAKHSTQGSHTYNVRDVPCQGDPPDMISFRDMEARLRATLREHFQNQQDGLRARTQPIMLVLKMRNAAHDAWVSTDTLGDNIVGSGRNLP